MADSGIAEVKWQEQFSFGMGTLMLMSLLENLTY